MPETHEAEIQAEDDVTKVRKDSADIMNESRSIRKWAPSRISLVKISLGLTAPGTWYKSTSLAWMLSRTAQSLRQMWRMPLVVVLLDQSTVPWF